MSVSLANSEPKFFSIFVRTFILIKLSGLAKYIYSKTQGLGFCLGKGLIDLNFSFSTITISPFSTSLIKDAPTISKAQVSDAKMNEFFNFPITKGLIPKGFSHANQFFISH